MCVPEHSHPPASLEQESLHTAVQHWAGIRVCQPLVWASQQMVVIQKCLWCREAEGEPAQGLLLLKDGNVPQLSVGLFLARISCVKMWEWSG